SSHQSQSCRGALPARRARHAPGLPPENQQPLQRGRAGTTPLPRRPTALASLQRLPKRPGSLAKHWHGLPRSPRGGPEGARILLLVGHSSCLPGLLACPPAFQTALPGRGREQPPLQEGKWNGGSREGQGQTTTTVIITITIISIDGPCPKGSGKSTSLSNIQQILKYKKSPVPAELHSH
ncbi:UNVERIFIED_CONTAM: hypothetical protein K2H54_056747, partial [Gekko kuhli]